MPASNTRASTGVRRCARIMAAATYAATTTEIAWPGRATYE
jgi:hypothetical protein